MLLLPPKAATGLPFSTEPRGAKLAHSTLLAPAEDTVVERLVGRGEDFDLAEPAVDLGVDRGRDHVMNRGQWSRGFFCLGVIRRRNDVGDHWQVRQRHVGRRLTLAGLNLEQARSESDRHPGLDRAVPSGSETPWFR